MGAGLATKNLFTLQNDKEDKRENLILATVAVLGIFEAFQILFDWFSASGLISLGAGVRLGLSIASAVGIVLFLFRSKIFSKKKGI